MDQPTTHQPEPGPDPVPGRGRDPGPVATPGAPRWLRVTAVAAAVASVLALAGVAAVARGGIGEHRGDHRGERMALAGARGPGAGPAGPADRADRAGATGGPRAGGGRLEGVRGRMAERSAARRAEAMATRHPALAEVLGVDADAVTAALEAGRAAGREAGLAVVAEALGVDVAELEAALADVMPGLRRDAEVEAEPAA